MLERILGCACFLLVLAVTVVPLFNEADKIQEERQAEIDRREALCTISQPDPEF